MPKRKNNRRPQGLTISQAIDGFVTYKTVEGLSERTIEGYQPQLLLFYDYIGDVKLRDVDSAETTSSPLILIILLLLTLILVIPTALLKR